MRTEPYQERATEEISAAVMWAAERAGVRHWSCDLIVATEEDDGEGDEICGAKCIPHAADESFQVVLWPQRCEAADMDPLFAVMHEIGHMLLWAWCEGADLDDRLEVAHVEQAACRVGALLYDLYNSTEGGA